MTVVKLVSIIVSLININDSEIVSFQPRAGIKELRIF